MKNSNRIIPLLVLLISVLPDFIISCIITGVLGANPPRSHTRKGPSAAYRRPNPTPNTVSIFSTDAAPLST